jgi:DNA-binding beta-propeller fold protein YncE
MRRSLPLSLGVLLVAAAGLFAAGFHVARQVRLPGDGFWDYVVADTEARRLYVTHGTIVHVLDLDTEKVVGEIAGVRGAHGVAVARDLDLGFVSSGGENEVVAFRLGSLASAGRVKTGTNPDAILYEPFTKRVIAFNGRSADATVIDPRQLAVVGTIALGGKPEFAVADGRGMVFVNIEDRGEIAVIDATTLAVKTKWPLAPCEEPSGLAIDTAGRRLFSVCANQILAVVNADSGALVAKVPIDQGPDAAVYDPVAHQVFSSNGSGTLTVVRQAAPDSYAVAETVQTVRGARTMAWDAKRQVLFLPVADFGPAPAATQETPRPRPSVVPGSFHLLVVSH